jgi:isoquinoline 1-oxidoreductase beta subunit
MTLNRRQFLSYSLYGGAFVMASSHLSVDAQDANATSQAYELSPLIKIKPNNQVTFYYPSPEMGQGVDTSLAMLFMEELGGDMALLDVDPLPYSLTRDKAGNVGWKAVPQGAGGSTSIPRNWPLLRKAGATARQLLVLAAADYWSVSVDTLKAKNAFVHHTDGRKLPFGKLVELAAKQTLPEGFEPKYKPKTAWHIIGQPHQSSQLEKIVTGQPLYAMDMDYTGARVAVISRSPYLDGYVEEYDATDAKKLPGVESIVELPRPNLDKYYTYLAAGIAVIANDFWTAKKARDLLKIKWNKGPHKNESTTSLEKQCDDLLTKTGQVIRDDGNFDEAMEKAEHTFSRTYQLPYVSHAQMEPQNCIAHVTDNNCTIIGPMQSPSGASRFAEAITGFDRVNMDIRYTRLGGGFGRRLTSDHVAEAVTISKLSGLPIKLIWTREDDMSHDFYRPMGHHKMSAGVDKKGNIIAWSHHLAGTPKYYRRDDTKPEELFGADMYIDDFPSRLVENLRYEYTPAKSGAPNGSWRAPAHTANCYAVQSFINEVAHQTNQDSLDLRLKLLGKARALPYEQHGGPIFDTGRMANVLTKVGNMANWGRDMPAGFGLGIAGHFTFGGYCAQIVELEMKTANQLKVHKVYCVIDVGTAINPEGIRAQVEGGINDGLSASLDQKINIQGGEVTTQNFDTYPMAYLVDSAHKIETYIVESDAEPAGAGEMAIPPLAPALCDAIAAITGHRIRSLPIKPHFNA